MTDKDRAKEILDKISEIGNDIQSEIKRGQISSLILFWDSEKNELAENSKYILKHLFGFSDLQIIEKEKEIKINLIGERDD